MTGSLRGEVVPGIALFDIARYDRGPLLSSEEQNALADLAQRHRRGRRCGPWPNEITHAIDRLTRPLSDVLAHIWPLRIRESYSLRHSFTQSMHETQLSFWGWSDEQWIAAIRSCDADVRRLALGASYHLTDYRYLHAHFPRINRHRLAAELFGTEPVAQSVEHVRRQLDSWGYGSTRRRDQRLTNAMYEVMLESGSARVEDFSPKHVAAVLTRAKDRYIKWGLHLLVRAMRAMGLPTIATAVLTEADWAERTINAREDVPEEWGQWAQKWFLTSTLSRRSRDSIYYDLMKTGRWLARRHPDCLLPASWTRAVATDWVVTVDRMLVGEWAHAPSTFRYEQRVGLPLGARTKEHHIGALRTFFRDCQEWEWIPRRFDPTRALATPRAVRALIGPDPRVIGDDVWVKLLWAGLNLTADDLPRHSGSPGHPWYPMEMARAVALVWLFAGLRVGEIIRLRTGCIRWQRQDAHPADVPPHTDAVCLLDIPVHKTGTAFTKPVDRVVGDAIDAWQQMRPQQPPLVDPKTGESVHLLFTYRGMRMGKAYVNRTLIPLLCRKANVPINDARGKITSHRARSTIASQLYNAKEPMTLFELQAWLGHRSPSSTQHYARITPTTLTKAYRDAGYFERNVRAIKVLLDRDAVTAGTATTGQPWQYFDLGHGYCTYNFFEQCPHRMACARCDFYVPKDSSSAQLLEAKSNLQRMLVEIPLTDDERAAVEDGQHAVDSLLKRLADVATPAGATPRELTSGRPLVMLPMYEPPKESLQAPTE